MKVSRLLLRFIFFIVSISLILFAAFVFGGNDYLFRGVWGSDTGNALAIAAWVDKFFPRIPFWYPLAGGGVSYLYSYFVSGFYLVSILKRIFPLDLIQAFRLLGFLSVLLTSAGIYFLVFTRFKNQTAAFFASIFYLASPLAWTWLIDWGMYAETISHMFIAPTILFWDLFFVSYLESKHDRKERLYLALCVIFLVAASLVHLGSGLGLLVFLAFYILGYMVFYRRRDVLVKGLSAYTILIILFLLLSVFILAPFGVYSQAASVGIGGKMSLADRLLNQPQALKILGFEEYNKDEFLFASRNISFPGVVSLFAVAGVLVSFLDPRLISFSLYSLYAIFLSINGYFIYFVSNHNPFPTHPFFWRYSFIPLRIAFPVIAAVGIFLILDKLWTLILKKNSFLQRIVVSILGIAIILLALYKLAYFPSRASSEWKLGLLGVEPRNIWNNEGLKICLVQNSCKKGQIPSFVEQVFPSGWPGPSTARALYDKKKEYQGFRDTLEEIGKENPDARIDFSPYASAFSMIAPFFDLNTNLSQIHIYTSTSSLIRRFIGQQESAYYYQESFYGNDEKLINDWARWFGINYIFFTKDTDSKIFEKGGWLRWKENIYKFPEQNTLAEVTTRPAVLVISQQKTAAYDQIFRLAGHGVLPYKDAILVQGREAVDSYSLSELKNFKTLLLGGYTYSDFAKADKLLFDYVEAGGSVFIDTGWQYTVPNWKTDENHKALSIIPLNKLEWKDLGKTKDFGFEDEKFKDKVDLESFGPLVYSDGPWGVSTSERSNLKDGAKVILSTKGFPLLATFELGKGKVVWSGMNIIAHAKQKTDFYWGEIALLKNIFNWLNEQPDQKTYTASYVRNSPDRVEFSFDKGIGGAAYLLWKESYYPDFGAYLSRNNRLDANPLPVYKAGPGWALIRLPSASTDEKIVYLYRKPTLDLVFELVSFVSWLVILSVLITGRPNLLASTAGIFEKIYSSAFFGWWRLPRSWINRTEEETDY